MLAYTTNGLDLLLVLAAFALILVAEHVYRLWQRWDEDRRDNRLWKREMLP